MTAPSDSPVIYRVAVPVPLPGLFDYLAGEAGAALLPGQRVRVPFGRRELVGVVVAQASSSTVAPDRLQALSAVLDDATPVMSQEQLRLLNWCAHYYRHPTGEVIFNALPPALRKTEGSLPDPPVQYRLTAAGKSRLAEGPGRAVAQYRLLRALEQGALAPETLRAEHNATAALLRRLLSERWAALEPRGAGVPVPVAGPELTAEQRAAVEAIGASLDGYACHLLDGITGSGKTEVYLQLAERVLAAGRQVLLLVPEIGLTPQLLRRFRERLGMEPLLSHSAVASGERLQAWAAALRGDARLLIGTRSALFLPLRKPGLVILDESHDASFKQQDGFRYSARDVAVKRAHDLGVPIVLGTATPSLETLHNARAGRYQHHRLRQRATGAASPAWRVIDLRQQRVQCGLSDPALDAIEERLDRDEQVLVFLNRRGYAPVLLCHDCGWHASCEHCDANMTWHRSGAALRCHHCGAQARAPRFCPACRADALQGAGQGTEQLERFLAQRFPDTSLIRVDRDSVSRKGELEAVIDRVRSGEPCILVGTQMLAKGHHFPRVTLVLVVDLDQALYSADFRAVERMGQVLLQVAGRAGRDQMPGTVVLQTHHPEHDGLQRLRTEGYETFAEYLLEERRLAGLPPFAFQATLRADERERGRVLAFLEAARACWDGPVDTAYGPMPAMMERRGGRLRWYLLLQHEQRGALQALLSDWLPKVRALPEARRVRWALDVDPQDF